MKLRHNETGRIFTSEGEFRLAYPNVSFPTILDESALNFANVAVVIETLPPSITQLQRVDYDGVQFVDGQWRDVWSVHNKYDDPTQQAAWEAECLETQWGWVRDHRNLLLSETDYTDLPNTPITPECKAEFIAYRQTLRDITSTQTDPYNIIWPQIPTYIRA